MDSRQANRPRSQGRIFLVGEEFPRLFGLVGSINGSLMDSILTKDISILFPKQAKKQRYSVSYLMLLLFVSTQASSRGGPGSWGGWLFCLLALCAYVYVCYYY